MLRSEVWPTLRPYRQSRSRPPWPSDAPPAAAGNFTLRSRASRRASPCATAWNASVAPGAISNQARFRREQVTFAGKATTWMRTAESGNALTFHFCPICGSTVYWEGEGFPGYIAVAIGNFADPNFPAPTIAVWRSYATPGSPCRPTRRPSARRSRGDKTTGGLLPGVALLSALGLYPRKRTFAVHQHMSALCH